MASPNVFINGIGGSSGATLVSLAPLYASGNVWFVSSAVSGAADAGSPAGLEREKPLLTIAQAHTNASAGDVIVCLSGHTESLAAAQTFNKAGILVLGEGTGSSRPKFTRTADVVMFDVTAARVVFDNLFFEDSTTAASTSARLRFAAAGNQCINCYFESNTFDDGPALETVTGASDVLIEDTTFISVASAVSDRPDSAIKVTNAISGLELRTVVMSGGTSGWAQPYAFNGAGAITTLKARNVDLLLGSDVTLATGTTGVFHVRNKSGSSRVVWTA